MSRWRLRRTLIYFALTLFGACPLFAQSYRWPDRARLKALADSAGIDQRAVLAIAWEETADNIDPRVRGHHCWYVIPPRADTVWTRTWPHILEPSRPVIDTVIVIPRRTHHEPDCEVGRFQIKPSTARFRCPNLNVFTYDGNLTCFARMFAQDAAKGGNLYAITRHNGAGAKAAEYLGRVLKTVGWLVESSPSETRVT